jgi:hypothetical protein
MTPRRSADLTRLAAQAPPSTLTPDNFVLLSTAAAIMPTKG